MTKLLLPFYKITNAGEQQLAPKKNHSINNPLLRIYCTSLLSASAINIF
jgi:hypothetical protein